MLKPSDFFDLSTTQHSDLFENVEYVWDVIKRIPHYIELRLLPKIDGEVSPQAIIGRDVAIGPGTVVEAGAVIKGPAIIGAGCRIGSGAYIRENVLVSDNAVVGHTTELKNCVFLEGAGAPHFSYVGDSVLGQRAHLGAGAKISNFKINKSFVTVKIDGHNYDTGLLKFGAIMGDDADVGCNAVLNPGTLIGKRTLVYANASILGYFPPDSIVKLRQTTQVVERKHRL